jgi:hypothetical protein
MIMISGTLADVIGEMRGWLSDCGFVDVDPEDVSDRTVTRVVHKTYSGGTDAFVVDTVGRP